MRLPLCLLFGVLAFASCISAAPAGPSSFDIFQDQEGPATSHALSSPTIPPHLLQRRGRIGDKLRGTYQVASMFLPRITGKWSRKDAVGVMKHVGKKAGRAGKGVVSYAAGKVLRTMGGRRYARVRRSVGAEGEGGRGREGRATVDTLQ